MSPSCHVSCEVARPYGAYATWDCSLPGAAASWGWRIMDMPPMRARVERALGRSSQYAEWG